MGGGKQTAIKLSNFFLIICAPWKRDRVQFDEIEISDARISSTTDARNLGVIMDKSLNMEKHIQNFVKHQSLSLETSLMCENIWHRMQQKS